MIDSRKSRDVKTAIIGMIPVAMSLWPTIKHTIIN
jgi:hypothetical protein